jgi:CDP-paratose 2-epimerase
MKIAFITGSGGLIGSESVKFFSDKFDLVIGVDNNYREILFGKDASVEWNLQRLSDTVPNYKHINTDIRNYDALKNIFLEYGKDISIVIHAAAQPSHDWAAKDPLTDFGINATGTLNLLELVRLYSPESTFIFTSTNKVYGDNPNFLPLTEKEKRWEISEDHPYFKEGIDEHLSIDKTKHSLFGASKLSADILVQEYGKYFNMKTGVFRGGCLTGPNHSGTQLHGFLSYLVKCAVTEKPYTVFGYKGKQVRDNLHSWDLVNMFWHFHQNPRNGEVYNAGGGRHSNCSVLEAIDICESLISEKMNYCIVESNRVGDHIWWISDVSKFKSHYPAWTWKYGLREIITEIYHNQASSLTT